MCLRGLGSPVALGSGGRWGEPWGSSLSPSSSPLHRTVFFQLEAEATPLLCAIGRHPCALASGCQHMGGTWPEAKAASCFSAVTPGHALGGWTEARAYSAAACEPSPAEPLDRHPTRCRRTGLVSPEPRAGGRLDAARELVPHLAAGSRLWENSVCALGPSGGWTRPTHAIKGVPLYIKPADCRH